jgi:hypothetical protein
MSTLNLILQSLHNLTRWAVVIFGVIAVVRGFTGWFGKRRYNAADNRFGMLFVTSLDVQLLLGLALYFTKGWANVLFSDPATAMGSSGVRFFAVEHLALMLVAIVLAHIVRGSVRKAGSDRAKHQRSALGFLFAFLLVLAAIPWPFLPAGRPLLRFFGLF